MLSKAVTLRKEEARGLLQKRQYREARGVYEEALLIVQSESTPDKSEMSILYLNIGICH